ncbi:nicotinate-nucleotide-dimethylbenzimidazole phosphoribosyltransferase [Pseudonocardia thermophila]|uniref:Nicotinate-nucleotide--dimethylbenzimidazole phosphoribosyltransferase n=1 Tax=Pseudonocardia thermophila TaxID=1848 RepID=A0A1M6R377_PSETH|nr:nicotinate-nucleotide--dimethylbenzimidazole phosphoribosyltransferase [Pseudonocardia thermophila]SHK26788.1 nicotinate-nucleotide-dimethylbenzimidazole phosphoribosyltransferase [Pseudonocardia thermophila]
MDLPAVPAPDAQARRAAVARYTESAVADGALGRLAELGVWLAATRGTCPPPPPARARIVVIAGDHGIAEAGVSMHPAGSTAKQVATLHHTTSPVATLAPEGGATVRAIDVALTAGEPTEAGPYRVRAGSGRIDREDALTEAETTHAVGVGRAIADEEVDAGADLLVPASLGVGATTPAEVIVAALTGTEPVAVVGRGSGIDDNAWMRKAAAVRDALRRTKGHRNDPLTLLRVAGGADIAALTGFCLQAALRRTPVLLDGGVVPLAAAMLAERLAPGAKQWWLLAQRSTDPAAAIAAERLDLEPLVELGIRLGDGTGAAAAIPLIRMAALLLAGAAPA